MLCKSTVGIGVIALSVGLAACNRPAQETRDEAKETSAKVAEAAADAQRNRDAEIARLSDRIAALERDYAAKTEQLAAGTKTATANLREEVQEDVTNVKNAVANLSTTTADNWWDREEAAMRRNIDDVGADVKKLAANIGEAAPVATDTPSTAPFTSRRDAFVTEMKGRLNTFRRALDDVKAKGPREAELSDTKARVEKMAEDLDKLASASADDWWNVTTDRVEAYLDRVEASIKRLDDHKPAGE